MNLVWIVFGQTGEYEDNETWEVAAFSSEEKAAARVLALNEWCENLAMSRNNPSDDLGHWKVQCPLDPKCRTDYNGIQYACYSIPFEE